MDANPYKPPQRASSGLIVAIVVRTVLRKSWPGFRIVLVPKEWPACAPKRLP